MRPRNILIFLTAVIALVAGLVFLSATSIADGRLDLQFFLRWAIVSEDDFLMIHNGDSLDAVKEKLNIAARHEFTIADGGASYTLVSCTVLHENGPVFWLLFRDKKLLKIIDPISFFETRTKSWDIDDPAIMGRVRKVIDASALTQEEILTRLKSPHNGDMGTHARPMFGGIFRSRASREKEEKLTVDHAYNQATAGRYDSYEADLGMQIGEILNRFHEPLRTIPLKNGGEAQIYADTRISAIDPELRFNGVAIVIDKGGHVVAVYSHRFFDDAWKNAPNDSLQPAPEIR